MLRTVDAPTLSPSLPILTLKKVRYTPAPQPQVEYLHSQSLQLLTIVDLKKLP